MFGIQSVRTDHKDLVHDVAFDHYGQRMATCSSDQYVKVWDLDKFDDEWKQTAAWKAHSGSVWKVTWAHPEFGQVLATCSFDRTAAVWEEIVGESTSAGTMGLRHWARRTNLVDSRTSVMDIRFAPKSLGLVLATCSADGIVRIYEAPDVMNLSQWTLQQEVACKLLASCLAWNPSYSRSEEMEKTSFKYPSNEKDKNELFIVIPHVPMLAVGSDDVSSSTTKTAVLQYVSFSRRWAKIDNFPVVTDPVHDLAFSPRLGRSYDLLAVASKDVKLFLITQLLDVLGSFRYEIIQITTIEDHYSSVWRVSWNSVGSVLASTGDDGCIRMWRQCAVDLRDGFIEHLKPGGMLVEDKDKDVPKKRLPIKDTLRSDTLPQEEACIPWRCITVLKGDGDVLLRPGVEAMAEPPVLHTFRNKYLKLVNMSHPAQVSWH